MIEVIMQIMTEIYIVILPNTPLHLEPALSSY